MTVFANKTPMRFSEKFLSFCGGMADKTTCGMYELTVYMNFRVTGIFGLQEWEEENLPRNEVGVAA